MAAKESKTCTGTSVPTIQLNLPPARNTGSPSSLKGEQPVLFAIPAPRYGISPKKIVLKSTVQQKDLPLVSKATHKNSLRGNNYLIASDYLHNKEEMDLHSNFITESKLTECNRISFQFVHKKQCHKMNQVTIITFNNV